MPEQPKNISKDDLLDFSRFAALSRCLLVDPQPEMRQEITRSLKASLLFEELLEATTLVNIAAKLQRIEFDACILGPSIKPSLAIDFAERQRPHVLSKDCSFIAIAPVKAVKAMRPKAAGKLHAVIEWPCTKRAFTEGVVRGVILANEGTIWPGVKLSDEGKVLIRRNGNWVDFCAIDELASADADLYTDQHDDERVKALLNRLLEHVNRPLPENAEEDRFTRFFEDCVTEWLVERSSAVPAEAAKKLKRKLLSFQWGSE